MMKSQKVERMSADENSSWALRAALSLYYVLK